MENLGCFHILAMVNGAIVNIGVHVSFQISVFVFFTHISFYFFLISCPHHATDEILFPQPGIEPMPHTLKVQSP